jgi:hypothetical protein
MELKQISIMKPERNKRLLSVLTAKDFTGMNAEMFISTYQDLKLQLWLTFFMLAGLVTRPSKNKERHYTTGIGLS